MFYDQSINTKVVKLPLRLPGSSGHAICTQWEFTKGHKKCKLRSKCHTSAANASRLDRAESLAGSSRSQKWSVAIKALHCTEVYNFEYPYMYINIFIFLWTLISADLKPSRQCSCRLTHTGSYTICQVQNAPSFQRNKKIKLKLPCTSGFTLAETTVTFQLEACGASGGEIIQ